MKPILQANADGSLKKVVEPDALVLLPFPDGSCIKHGPREWTGKPEHKPVDHDQRVIINAGRDQLAITKNTAIAELICDAVNMLFAAQAEHDRAQSEQRTDLTGSILSGKEKVQ